MTEQTEWTEWTEQTNKNKQDKQIEKVSTIKDFNYGIIGKFSNLFSLKPIQKKYLLNYI